MSVRFSALNRGAVALLALAACASDPVPEAVFEPIASYACEGGASVVIGEGQARVLDGEDAFRLTRTDEEGTYRGDDATVTVRPGAVTYARAGGEAVACAPTESLAGAAPPSVVAFGRSPHWRLTIDPDRMRLTREDGGPLALPAPTPRRLGRIATWTTEEGGDALEARLSPGPCREAGALPTPLNAEVTANGRYYRGCSGDPAELLVGTWSVRGEGAAISLGADGTVGVATGCNDAATRYTVTETALAFGAFRQTRMACPGEAGWGEERVLGFLRRTDGFDVGERDELVLLAGEQTLLLTRLPD